MKRAEWAEFTFGGTLGIIIGSLIPSIIFGLAYQYLRRFLPGGGYLESLAYGVILGILLGLPVLFASSELALARVLAVPVAFFLGLPVVYGLILEWSYSSSPMRQPSIRWTPSEIARLRLQSVHSSPGRTTELPKPIRR